MNTPLSHIAILAVSLAVAAGAAHARTFHQQVAAEPHGEVDISNVAGSIVIRAWDKPAVAVTAYLRSGIQRVLVTSRAGRTRVCVTNNSASCSSWSGSRRARSARLEVRVPSDSEIDASGVSAVITSRGVGGVQHLHTVSGDIDAELGAGHDSVDSVSGTITLHGSARDGMLRVANVSGDLRVTNVAGELEARTVNGRLSAQLSSARRVRLHTVSGTIELDARLVRGGTVEAQTVSGSERIRVAAAAGYSYAVRTFSGNIEDCFGQQVQRHRYGPGSLLDGTRGEGAGRIRLKTLSGNVSLCDH